MDTPKGAIPSRQTRYLVNNGRGRPSKKPVFYQCPLEDEESSGAVGTRDELLEHLLEDHLMQETRDDFIKEVLDSFLCEYSFIRGLLHK